MPQLSTYSYLDANDTADVLDFKRLAGTSNVINVKTDCGGIGDGSAHALSTVYGSLGAAQAVYPFATDLAQEIDYCACKLASNLAFGGDLEVVIDYELITDETDANHLTDDTQSWTVNEHAGKTAFRKFASNGFVDSCVIISNTATTLTLTGLPFGAVTGLDTEYAIGYGEHGSANVKFNKSVYIPAGRYRFGNDTWTIRNLASGKIYGDGRLATTLTSNATVLAFDGIWYSDISDLSLLSLLDTATVALDMDGNVPGHAYATRGVQGVHLRNMLIDGGGSTYAFAMCRLGGSNGQGSECLFSNVHVNSASEACYYQNGFNALANTFIGGNFQNYDKHGIYVIGGNVALFNTGFQSTVGYRQIENDGYDIRAGDSGVYNGVSVYNCRTESLRFLYNGGGAVLPDVRGCSGNLALSGWFAERAYGPVADAYKAIREGNHLYVATTPGTSGLVEPTWPTDDGATVADGTIVWTETPMYFIYTATGTVDLNTTFWDAGTIVCPPKTYGLYTDVADFGTTSQDSIIVDATAGATTVTLPTLTGIERGRTITVKKVDTSVNAVTVSGAFEDGAVSYVIPGGSRGFVTATYNDGVGGARKWQVISESQTTNPRLRAGNINAQTGTTYTLLISDDGKTVTCSNASAITLTVPASLGVAFQCKIIQIGAGQVTLATSGTTLNANGGSLKIAQQYGEARIYAYAANTFDVVGDLAGTRSATAYRTTSDNINAQTGTSYTLLAADNGKTVTLSNAAAITLTVPAGLGAGFSCTLIQIGAGQVTVTASSTTINPASTLKIAVQDGCASLYAYAADTFNLAGNITA